MTFWTVNLVSCVFMLKTFWAVSGSNFQPLDYATIALGKGWSVNSVGCVFALETDSFR